MIKRFITIFAAAALMCAPLPLGAEQPADDDDTEEEEVTDEETSEDSDEDVRLAPVIDVADDDDIDIPVPSFINRSANHINFNGANWNEIRKAFANAGKDPVSIVHIGDSHVQADYNTAVTRNLLQYDFGNAGRGLITPLKLSGTNQPIDYTFSSNGNWTPVKLMSRTWTYPMGFTGTSIHPGRNDNSITVGTSERDDYNPFRSITIFHGGKLSVDNIVADDGRTVKFKAIPSHDYTQIVMDEPETKVTINFASQGDLTIYGVSLGADSPGLYYHAIGNNGATFATYNRIGNVGAGIAPLKPEIVIISLGTNEAFGNVSAQSLYKSIDMLVKNIQTANPKAQILLMTPMECQRSVSKTTTKKVKVKNRASGKRKGKRKGKRRGRRSRSTYTTKTVKSTTRSYQINNNVRRVRDEIIRYAADNHIALLDWYEVAGGEGASKTWIDHNLFSRDRVHHSVKGYHLQGRLVYDALIEGLINTQK